MKTVVLKNGAEEILPLTEVISLVVNELLDDGDLAVYDLVMMCRDPNYNPFPSCLERLKARSLVEPDGRVHQSIRNVVLSMAEGDGLEMKFSNPVKEISDEQAWKNPAAAGSDRGCRLDGSSSKNG